MKEAAVETADELFTSEDCSLFIKLLNNKGETPIITSLDGKKVFSFTQLKRIVTDTLAVKGGRLTLAALGLYVEVDSPTLNQAIREITSSDEPDIFIVNGDELVTTPYLQELVEFEIAPFIYDVGYASFTRLSSLFNAPSQLLLSTCSKLLASSNSSRSSSIDFIVGGINHSYAISSRFYSRIRSQIRGTLSAATKPVPLAPLISLGSPPLEESDIIKLIEVVIATEGLGGKLKGGASYIPDVFTKTNRGDIETLFTSQGFIQYATLRSKYLIAKPQEFIIETFPGAVSIGNKFAISGSIVRTLDAALRAVADVVVVGHHSNSLGKGRLKSVVVEIGEPSSSVTDMHHSKPGLSESSGEKHEQSLATATAVVAAANDHNDSGNDADMQLLSGDEAWLDATTLLPANISESDVQVLLQHCLSLRRIIDDDVDDDGGDGGHHSSSSKKKEKKSLGDDIAIIAGVYAVNKRLFSVLLNRFRADAEAVLPPEILKIYTTSSPPPHTSQAAGVKTAATASSGGDFVIATASTPPSSTTAAAAAAYNNILADNTTTAVTDTAARNKKSKSAEASIVASKITPGSSSSNDRRSSSSSKKKNEIRELEEAKGKEDGSHRGRNLTSSTRPASYNDNSSAIVGNFGDIDSSISELVLKHTKPARISSNIKKWCPDLGEEFYETLLKGILAVLKEDVETCYRSKAEIILERLNEDTRARRSQREARRDRLFERLWIELQVMCRGLALIEGAGAAGGAVREDVSPTGADSKEIDAHNSHRKSSSSTQQQREEEKVPQSTKSQSIAPPTTPPKTPPEVVVCPIHRHLLRTRALAIAVLLTAYACSEQGVVLPVTLCKAASLLSSHSPISNATNNANDAATATTTIGIVTDTAATVDATSATVGAASNNDEGEEGGDLAPVVTGEYLLREFGSSSLTSAEEEEEEPAVLRAFTREEEKSLLKTMPKEVATVLIRMWRVLAAGGGEGGGGSSTVSTTAGNTTTAAATAAAAVPAPPPNIIKFMNLVEDHAAGILHLTIRKVDKKTSKAIALKLHQDLRSRALRLVSNVSSSSGRGISFTTATTTPATTLATTPARTTPATTPATSNAMVAASADNDNDNVLLAGGEVDTESFNTTTSSSIISTAGSSDGESDVVLFPSHATGAAAANNNTRRDDDNKPPPPPPSALPNSSSSLLKEALVAIVALAFTQISGCVLDIDCASIPVVLNWLAIDGRIDARVLKTIVYAVSAAVVDGDDGVMMCCSMLSVRSGISDLHISAPDVCTIANVTDGVVNHDDLAANAAGVALDTTPGNTVTDNSDSNRSSMRSTCIDVSSSSALVVQGNDDNDHAIIDRSDVWSLLKAALDAVLTVRERKLN